MHEMVKYASKMEKMKEKLAILQIFSFSFILIKRKAHSIKRTENCAVWWIKQ